MEIVRQTAPFPPDERMQVLQSEIASEQSKETAFGEIVNEYQLDLTRFAKFLFGDMAGPEQAAEDIVQDTFMRVWTRNHQFRHKPDNSDALKAWLLTVTHNLVIDRMRRRTEVLVDPHGALEAVDNDQAAFGHTPQLADPFSKLAFQETIDELRQLQPARFNFLMLSGLGYSPDEISEILEVSRSAVDGMVHRGRRDIKSKPKFESFRQQNHIGEHS
jgi:RNA polymerase sigma factor (sigma-70 family)